jgi:uncharacterized protein YdhG (YjbR/CyaY superfamily)
MDPIAFVARHGVVLASGSGPVPSLAEAVAGEPIRGSWWAHPKGKAIFRALSDVADSPDVLSFRLVGGKVTLVHRRLWPALVRLAKEIGARRLDVISQEHTASGAHRNAVTPWPRWAGADVKAAAARLSVDEARAQLGEGILKGRVAPLRAEKPETIDEYLAGVAPGPRKALQRLRKTMRKIAPRAEECISYSIPAFRLEGRIIGGFAATKKGCSYFPFSGSTLRTLKKEIAGYGGTKSSLHFDPAEGLPEPLVRKLVRARMAERKK